MSAVILIVDANASYRELLRGTLEAERFTVVEAGDGVEALEILDRQHVDVVVSDQLSQRVSRLEERNAELERLNTELGLANDKLRHVLLHSPAVIYELGIEDGAILPEMVSESMPAMLGFAPAETLHHEWWVGQIHPDDVRDAVAGMTRSLGQSHSRAEYRIRHMDGTYRWVEDNRRLIRDAAGAPLQMIGVWTDITERKQLELELSARDQQLNAFFSNATAGLCILDRDFRYVQLNETLAAINGVPRIDHLGKTMAEVLPTLCPVVEPILRRVLMTGESTLNVEVSGVLPDDPKRIHHWMTSFFPVIDRSGRPDCIGVVVVEVTDRRNAERALRESEATFLQFAEHVPEVFWMSPPDMSSILYVSPAYESVWGRSVARLYTHPHEWIDAIVPEDRERVGAAFARLGTSDQVTAEYRIRRPDGSIRWILDNGFAIRDAAGQAYRTAGIAMDVTDRMRLEEALRRSQKLDAIGQLVGGIAHEINTPMQYIGNNVRFAFQAITRLFTGDLVGGDADRAPADLAYLLEEVPKALEQSLQGVERVTRIVASMGALTRHNDGIKELADINSQIESAVTLAASEWKHVAKVDYVLEPALPPVRCLSDEVSQVFLHLIVNAAHAIEDSPRAGIQGLITVSSRREGDQVEIRVADNGTGIAAEIRHRVFDPFFTTREVGRGTGHGLTLAHAVVVQRHGGSLRFETESGAGTTFIMTLPIEPDHAASCAGATI